MNGTEHCTFLRACSTFVLVVCAAFSVASCTPSIGDKCTLSTDCSANGDRLCDTSQPDGYCTVFNCQADQCPDKAACILFNAAVPGCGFNDRNGASGARTARSSCSARCQSDSDCRSGYLCADARNPPWNALILDDDQNQLTCLVIPADFSDAGAEAGSSAVCAVVGPDVPAIEAGAPEISDGEALPPLFPDAGDAD
ncbi:MAG: hypothetical protein FWD69_03190 [Polyangiaceae bacterium]|nr:hypothetical protein [Polyangiaceae bacterium]